MTASLAQMSDLPQRERFQRDAQRLRPLMRAWGLAPADCRAYCGDAARAILADKFEELQELKKDDGEFPLHLVPLVKPGVEALARVEGWDGDYAEIDAHLGLVAATGGSCQGDG